MTILALDTEKNLTPNPTENSVSLITDFAHFAK